MDQLTFIATIIGHLAWPVTVLVILQIVLFRLPNLAKFIKTIRYKDLEVTLREEFSEARTIAEGIAVEEKPALLPDAQADKIIRLVEIDPSIAIIEIWRRLEQEITELIQHNGLMRFTNPVKFIEQLVKLGKLTDADLLLFRKLREIRNTAVHARARESLSKGEVFEFNNFVELLIEKLDAIKEEPDYVGIPDSPAKE
jgi:hypothetical protein